MSVKGSCFVKDITLSIDCPACRGEVVLFFEERVDYFFGRCPDCNEPVTAVPQ